MHGNVRSFSPEAPRPPVETKPSPRIPRSPTLRDHWEYALVRGTTALLGSLPRRGALRLGGWIGDVFYLLHGASRRTGLRNLRRAFPDKSADERRAILRRASRNLGRSLAEICHFAELNADNVGRHVVPGDPNAWTRDLERASATGGIALTAHFGNFELLAYSQSLLGHRITVAHRTMRNPLVDRYILKIRSRAGTVSIPKKSAARDMLRALAAKRIVALPADQNQVQSFGVFADFFGIPACTTPGPARLAMHTGAPIVPVFLVREGESDRHRLVICPEVPVANTGDVVADVVETTRRCNQAIERVIREHPDQWVWFHKRWKTQPAGTPEIE